MCIILFLQVLYMFYFWFAVKLPFGFCKMVTDEIHGVIQHQQSLVNINSLVNSLFVK